MQRVIVYIRRKILEKKTLVDFIYSNSFLIEYQHMYIITIIIKIKTHNIILFRSIPAVVMTVIGIKFTHLSDLSSIAYLGAYRAQYYKE